MDGIKPKDVDRMLRQCLCRRSDLGLWNLVAAKILEPENPFGQGERERRTPQRWFVLLLVSLFAAVIAFVYFNLWN
jgi:hypothetical protein